MALVHRDTDSRICGASTIATASHTYVEGLLIARDGDPNSHGGGAINAVGFTNVYAEGIKVSVKGDPAAPDGLCPIPPHCNPLTVGSASNTYVG